MRQKSRRQDVRLPAKTLYCAIGFANGIGVLRFPYAANGDVMGCSEVVDVLTHL
jgi:hypothetical protein